MVFLKAFCAIGGFSLCAYGGYRYSRKHIMRERYFAEVLEFCAAVTAEINFVHLSLQTIMEKYAGSFKSFLSVQLAGVAALLEKNLTVDEAALCKYVPQGILTADEYETVIRFFNVLGKSDAENQTASVESFKTAFLKYHAAAAENKKKYSSLYWKLGLLAGAALAVFVI